MTFLPDFTRNRVPPAESDGTELGDLISETRSLLAKLEVARSQREQDTNIVINGQVDFPSQFLTGGVTREHTGNIRANYVTVEEDRTGGGGLAYVQLTVAHSMDRPPSFFIPIRNSTSAASTAGEDAMILDAWVTYAWNDPAATGNGYAGVDTSDGDTFTGNSSGNTNGWTGNNVAAGDEIWIVGDSKWREVDTITGGTPDSLLLTSTSDVTSVTNAEYVIRKRPDDTNIYAMMIRANSALHLVTFLIV